MYFPERVLVVGGGIIGTACAHYLERAGARVTIIDQGSFGRGCSHGNCGFVCPSQVLPLAAPGELWRTLKTLCQRNSPLKVRLRADPALWSWFWRFARHCNRADMLSAGEAIQALLASSRTLYDELFSAEGLSAEWQTRGLLYVLQSEAGMQRFAAQDRLLRDEFGVGATRLDQEAMIAFEPALRPGLAGGWHYAGDAHLRPDVLLRSWRKLLESRHVEIFEQRPFQGLIVDKGRASAVATPQGALQADAIVVATGAWTPLLHRALRSPLPIQPGKGYSLTTSRPTMTPRLPLMLDEHHVAITPFAGGHRIGSTMEFAGYDASLNRNRLRLLIDGAKEYLKEPYTEPVLEEWWGWRPMTPDGVPYLGRLPAFDNVFVAAGHNMLGLSMAPASGRLIAELVTGTTPHLEAERYIVGRK